jgi:hypothetical protein
VTDTATLTNTAHQPGTDGPTGSLRAGSINPTTLGGEATGTITFTLFKSDCTTPATGTGTNPQTVTTVSGNGTYGPVSFTPDAPGTYYWVATYGGDSPNTLASLASDSPCPDTSEDVVVQQIPTTIATTPSYFPQDSATVGSTVGTRNLPDNGTVTFRLYDSLSNCQAHGTTLNSGGLKFVEPVSIGTNPGTSKSVGTNNTSFRVSDTTTYYWWVTYAPGGSVFTGRQSDCVENIAATLTSASAPGTLLP